MLATRTKIPGTMQQALAGDVFSTYPANGVPATVNSGAVAKGMYHGPIPPNMLPRRLTRGMGDTVDLAGYYDQIGAGEAGSADVETGGGGFWDALGQTAINAIPTLTNAGVNIATARYAVPPPGTLIKTPTSMIYTQPTQQQGASLVSAGGLLAGGSSLLPLLIAGVVVVMLMKS